MAIITNLSEAVDRLIHDGDALALEGFTHLMPFAAAHEIIRQKKRSLTLIRMTPDIIYDQMIGMGCAGKIIFSWGGNPGVGSLHRLRDAIERQWPNPMAIEEHSHAAMANAYAAGAAGLPVAILRAYAGSDLPKYNPVIRSIECPFTGEKLAAIPALNPDVAVIHAQQADRQGNIHLWGITGIQKEAVLSARKAIVTVEEIVDEFDAGYNAVILPHWVIDAVVEVPGGAKPSYAHGYYERNNRFYTAWDQISRDRDRFLEWMERHILETANFDEYQRRLDEHADVTN